MSAAHEQPSGGPEDEGRDEDRDEDVDRPATGVGIDELWDQVPGLARIAATSALHTAEWGIVASLKASRRMAEAARDPRRAVELANDVGQAVGVVGEVARAVTGGAALPRALADSAAARGETLDRQPSGRAGRVVPTADLRARGEALLDRSRDVRNADVAHPAYARMLDELAPDEARVLVLLIRQGPQPSVDVRTGGPVGMVSSQLIAPGLTMIGPRAGVRYPDRVPAYLNNLFRLGLVWFSVEALRDPLHYQVLEAQPDVLAAMGSARFPKVVRRSIHLTPFGEDFCRTCLVDDEPVSREFPAHQPPPTTSAPEVDGGP